MTTIIKLSLKSSLLLLWVITSVYPKNVPAQKGDLSHIILSARKDVKKVQEGVYQGTGDLNVHDHFNAPSTEPFFEISYGNPQTPSQNRVIIYFSPSCSHCFTHFKDGTFGKLINQAQAGKIFLSFRVLEITPIDPFIVSICMGKGEESFLGSLWNYMKIMDDLHAIKLFQTKDKQQQQQILDDIQSRLSVDQKSLVKSDSVQTQLLQTIALLANLDPKDIDKASDYLRFIQNSRDPNIPISGVPVAFKNRQEVNIKSLLS